MHDRPVHHHRTSTFEAAGVHFPPEDQSMHISLGSDHAGYRMKQVVLAWLQGKGIQVTDRGTGGEESVDYPDHAHAVAADVAQHQSELGILLCGSANGVNMTANKHTGVRSAIAWNEEVARLARQHNDANVLALPARFIDEDLALRIVEAFLGATFEGGRHARRVEKMEPAQWQQA